MRFPCNLLTSNHEIADTVEKYSNSGDAHDENGVVHLVVEVNVNKQLQRLDNQRKAERREEDAADEHDEHVDSRPPERVAHAALACARRSLALNARAVVKYR